jgi:integrase
VCIQWHNNTILVPAPKSKNGKARAVPMTQRVKKILEKWSAISGSKNKTKVFYGLSKDSVRHYWDTIRAEMGWQDDKNYCPYICRHTCASRLVMSGVGLPKVMAWMGHTRWETTMGYAHLAPSALNELASVLDNRSKIIDAKPDTLKLIKGSN